MLWRGLGSPLLGLAGHGNASAVTSSTMIFIPQQLAVGSVPSLRSQLTAPPSLLVGLLGETKARSVLLTLRVAHIYCPAQEEQLPALPPELMEPIARLALEAAGGDVRAWARLSLVSTVFRDAVRGQPRRSRTQSDLCRSLYVNMRVGPSCTDRWAQGLSAALRPVNCEQGAWPMRKRRLAAPADLRREQAHP